MVILCSCYKRTMLHYLLTCRTFIRSSVNKPFKHLTQIIGKVIWNLTINTFKNGSVKLLHILCLEWNITCDRLIQHYSQRPNITFASIRFIFPYFWTSIKRRSGLSIIKTLSIANFRNIHVSYFYVATSTKENIS